MKPTFLTFDQLLKLKPLRMVCDHISSSTQNPLRYDEEEINIWSLTPLQSGESEVLANMTKVQSDCTSGDIPHRQQGTMRPSFLFSGDPRLAL